ncbi:hypothetical protein EST38_g5740 [Candolleomyces aberdarensis]|uniref:F-box domain-containing protein n=1 Tax=Candolleomyces aberdarensis TaxID=2316362 RepID=A0A4Q2DJM0_9AGAR|nr:hypothetical protein EST38_g5740 [Candolleomyces aberdarensis]
MPRLEIKWVGSCIFVVSIVYTFLISRLTVTPTPIDIIPTPDIKRAKRLRRIHQEFEARQRRIRRGPFPLAELPPELTLQILGHCAESQSTVANLVLVSRRVQALTYEACLPGMAIRLIGEQQVESFDRLLLCKSHLLPYIHNLWVTPLQEKYYPAAIRILKKCTSVRSLAVNGRLLKESITSPHIGYRIRHTHCRTLTLLHTSSEGWASLFAPSAHQFLEQITHLRIVGDRIPVEFNFPLPNLRSFSYVLNRNVPNLAYGERILKDKDGFPNLRTVVLTGERRGKGGGARISKMKDTRLFVFEVPVERTDMIMWCDNTLGRGFWQLCAN